MIVDASCASHSLLVAQINFACWVKLSHPLPHHFQQSAVILIHWCYSNLSHEYFSVAAGTAIIMQGVWSLYELTVCDFSCAATVSRRQPKQLISRRVPASNSNICDFHSLPHFQEISRFVSKKERQKTHTQHGTNMGLIWDMLMI